MISRINALFSNRARLRELLLYLLFGVLTTAVNWVSYVVLTSSFGLSEYGEGMWQHKLIINSSNIVAWVIAVLFAFFSNKRYVFHSVKKSNRGAWKEFLMFVSARLFSLVLFDLALFNALVYGFGFGDKKVKLLMNVLVVVINYFASKFFIFRKGKAV